MSKIVKVIRHTRPLPAYSLSGEERGSRLPAYLFALAGSAAVAYGGSLLTGLSFPSVALLAVLVCALKLYCVHTDADEDDRREKGSGNWAGYILLAGGSLALAAFGLFGLSQQWARGTAPAPQPLAIPVQSLEAEFRQPAPRVKASGKRLSSPLVRQLSQPAADSVINLAVPLTTRLWNQDKPLNGLVEFIEQTTRGESAPVNCWLFALLWEGLTPILVLHQRSSVVYVYE